MNSQTIAKVIVAVIFVAAVQAMPTNAPAAADGENVNVLHHYRTSPRGTGAAKYSHNPEDPVLNHLDDALTEISTVYMQALFAGTHTAELEVRMRRMEVKLFDLLDALYRENRMMDYMHYESEVTRTMILYNMLKKLFGYAGAADEKA